MSPKIERVAEIKNVILGEGPHWDHKRQTLYQVDFPAGKILSYKPSTKKVAEISFAPKRPSFVVPVEGKDDQFVISLENELVIISWDGESANYNVVETLATVDLPNFNDGKCDSSGRLWAGAHAIDFENVNNSKPVGFLYSLSAQKELKSHVDKIALSNGMAFNDKLKKMWYIDTLKNTVDQFDFDVKTGSIANRIVWFSLEKHQVPGGPDGMTIDSDGNLWVAAFGGSRVLKIDGKKAEHLLETVELPAIQVTSVNFGGANLDELYVTAGRVPTEKGKEAPPAPVNGATYRVTGLGVKGLPANNFKYSKH